MKKLILIGFAATGKTSVGILLAQKLGVRFVDVDQLIQDETGLTVEKIFAQHGEAFFRKLEEAKLQQLTPITDAVIACGGGSVLSCEFAPLAATGKVVWLTASAATVKNRLTRGRPLFDGKTEQQLQRYIELREPLYRQYADVTICTDNLSVEQIANLLTSE